MKSTYWKPAHISDWVYRLDNVDERYGEFIPRILVESEVPSKVIEPERGRG